MLDSSPASHDSRCLQPMFGPADADGFTTSQGFKFGFPMIIQIGSYKGGSIRICEGSESVGYNYVEQTSLFKRKKEKSATATQVIG